VTQENKVTVYRFRKVEGGREISPQHMWGTAEAIAELGAQPIEETARTVHRKLLEAGFFFEQAAGNYISIEEDRSRDPR
jgi:hypothetical protein